MTANQPEVPNHLRATARDLLTSVHSRLNGVRAARTVYAKRLAPEFNALSLLRPDEVRLSSVFAELLNPEGRHAQGRIFFDLFAESLQLPDWVHSARHVDVRIESRADSLDRAERRIDVLMVLDGNAAVAIENKPWATDQDRQIADYLDHLKRTYGEKHVLLYLAADGRSPAETSIAATERAQALEADVLRIVGFGQLLPWIRSCRNDCEASNVAAFLAEVEQYIRSEFQGIRDMSEIYAVVDEATRTPASVEAALEIGKVQQEIRQRLIDTLDSQIRAQLHDRNLQWTIDFDRDWSRAHQGVGFHFSPADRYAVRFQFEENNGRAFFFGITKHADDDHLEDVRAAIDQEMKCIGKMDQTWAWYGDVESSLQNWHLSTEPWKKIADGSMAKLIVGLTMQIYGCLIHHGLLGRLGGLAAD